MKIKREGKFIIISNEKYGITTQGKSFREALFNFKDAFLICIHDPDWRHIHSMTEAEYLDFLKSEYQAPQEQITSINIGDLVSRLIHDVKKTSHNFGIATS